MKKWGKRILIAVIILAALFISVPLLLMLLDFDMVKTFIAG